MKFPFCKKSLSKKFLTVITKLIWHGQLYLLPDLKGLGRLRGKPSDCLLTHFWAPTKETAADKWLNEGPNSACSTQCVADKTLRISFPQNLAPQTTGVGKGLTRKCQAQGIMTRTNGHQLCSIKREGFLKTLNTHVHFPLLLHKCRKIWLVSAPFMCLILP
jgi:hypothetical protein